MTGIIVSILCLFFIMPLFADNQGIIEGNNVVVQYDEPLRNGAQGIIDVYPRIREELERLFGWEIDFRPTIALIRENERFQDIISNPHIIAVAIPDKRLVVIDYSKMNISPFTLEVTLKHEMCHLLLGKNIPGERLPRWFNEGFCQWATGGVAELMIDNKQPSLSKASLSHRLIPLVLLTRNFPNDRDQLILAYEESKSIVEYMVTEYGLNRVKSILAYLREGDTIESASSKALLLTLDELEKRWVKNLRGQITWIGYLSANIYSVLLFAAALLTICGFLRVILRRRRRASVTDEDDECGEY